MTSDEAPWETMFGQTPLARKSAEMDAARAGEARAESFFAAAATPTRALNALDARQSHPRSGLRDEGQRAGSVGGGTGASWGETPTRFLIHWGSRQINRRQLVKRLRARFHP